MREGWGQWGAVRRAMLYSGRVGHQLVDAAVQAGRRAAGRRRRVVVVGVSNGVVPAVLHAAEHQTSGLYLASGLPGDHQWREEVPRATSRTPSVATVPREEYLWGGAKRMTWQLRGGGFEVSHGEYRHAREPRELYAEAVRRL